MPRAPAGAAWAGCCGALALLAGGTLQARATVPGALEWQAASAFSQPWRWWTAAFVHLSPGHWAANAAGCVVLALFGLAARSSRRDLLAWMAAWPLVHLGLLWRPDLAHYAGLSGLLHAGVAVSAWGLVARSTGAPRMLGLAVLGGLMVKVLLESPWGPPVRLQPGWDIPVAPLAHATGVAAGLLCAAGAHGRSRAFRRPHAGASEPPR